MTFGDSITEGLFPFFIQNPPGSYPYLLETMLRARYTAQTSTIVVLDEGYGGEKVADGLARFGNTINLDAPVGAVLLIEGINDLNAASVIGPASAAIPTVVDGLRAMVLVARSRGIPVFLATLLPARQGGKVGDPSVIPLANDRIRAMAAAEGAILVDLYQALGGVPDPWIGPDGLHPSKVGLEKIAQTFFDAIRARFETNPGS
jgi:lysophospholipase L1-like esterase